MKVYLRNSKPFIPVKEGRFLCQEMLHSDLEEHFDLKSYICDYYYNETVELFNIQIQYEDLLDIISDTNKRILEADLSYDFAENTLEDCMDELEDEGVLELAKQLHVSENTEVSYEVVEFENELTDDAVDLYFKLI